LTERQGQQVGSPDEIAFQMGWLTPDQLRERAEEFGKNDYGAYLKSLTD
jgi:glucose-1-phosphate thymidylyltransferase